MTNYTNSTIRKKLGELGFFELKSESNQIKSVWHRGDQVVHLFEFANLRPVLKLPDGRILDVDKIGVLNPDIQNDGSPDE